jgi:TonB family protein
MGDFFVYSLKSSLCLAAFYLFYKLLLSRDTFHRFNRIALLGTMILSVIIPVTAIFLIPVRSFDTIVEAFPEQFVNQNPISPVMIEISPLNRLLSFILLVYLTGCSIFLIRSIRTIFRILQVIRKGNRMQMDNNIRLIIHSDDRIAPFSWMNSIVVSQTDMKEAGDTILLHEQAHIRQHHTLDLLLAELCILFQWYNPAAWLLYRELQHIHEFEADQSVLDQGINAKQYQLLLIKKAVGTRLYAMANSLNHSNLKKRITMMLQKKSSSWARLKYAYVLPLAVISMITFARPEISRSFDEISNAKVSNLILKVDPPDIEKISPEEIPITDNVVQNQVSDTTIFTIVDIQPSFPGGAEAMMVFFEQNKKYPEKAKKEGIYGRVTLQFVVEKDGSISNAQIIRGVDPELDAEAFRLVQSMPKWTPGKLKDENVRTKYTLPIRFTLPK